MVVALFLGQSLFGAGAVSRNGFVLCEGARERLAFRFSESAMRHCF